MKAPTGRTTRRVIASAAVLFGALLGVQGTDAYTVITRDGHRIEAEAKPEVKGLQAFLRLSPHHQLAVIQEDQIDWARTEAANPARRLLAVPADTRLVEEKKPAQSTKPIDVRIVGGARSADQAQPDKTLNPEAKKVHDQEGLINLQREYAKLQGLRDQSAGEKASLEKQLDEMRSKQTGYAGEDNAEARRIRELEDRLRELNLTIEKYENRMNDIRGEAIELGGSID